MRYFGGKKLLANDITTVLSSYRKEGQVYIEPFVGGGWVLVKMVGERKAMDKNPYLIDMWQSLQKGWSPPDNISEELYNFIKENRDSKAIPKALIAFIGFGCSFGGKWFGGYGRDAGGRNYAKEAKNSLLRKVPHIKDVDFECKDYVELDVKDCLIYCDPPYDGCADYTQTGRFNSKEFWEVARQWRLQGNTVIVSEYNAPEDFKCIWERNVAISATNLSTRKRNRAVEKLFM